jgi:hypothetical protein
VARQYYAAYRPYGIASLNTAGLRADVLVGFDRKADRDRWVGRDAPHREPVASSDTAVRAALRFEARDGYRVVRTPAEFAEGLR